MNARKPWVNAALVTMILFIGFLLHQSTKNSRNLQEEIERLRSESVFSRPIGKPLGAHFAISRSVSASRSLTPASQNFSLSQSFEKNEAEMLVKRGRRQRIVQNSFGELIEQLNLPPEKIPLFKQLLVERAAAQEDAAQIMGSAGKRGDMPEYWQAQAKATEAVHQEMAILLGEGGTEKLAEFLPLGRTYEMAQSLFGSRMGFSDVPLTKEQKLLLAKAMRDVGFSTENPNYYWTAKQSADPETGWNPVYQKLVEQAKLFLSSEQIAVLKQVQIEHDAGLPAIMAATRR